MTIKLKALSEQTVVITGGSSSIGLATARKAAEAKGLGGSAVAGAADPWAATCSSASAHGSGFITMPAPPP